MKILPTLAEVRKIASAEKYNVLPVSCEILSDFTTPIETIKILKNVSSHCYMLESAQANETWGRYTFLGFDPKMEITCIDGEMKIGNLKVKTDIRPTIFDKFLPITGARALTIFLHLRVDWSGIFHTIISVTASRPLNVMRKTARLSKTLI